MSQMELIINEDLKLPRITWIEEEKSDCATGLVDRTTQFALDAKMKKDELEKLKKPVINSQKINGQKIIVGDIFYCSEYGYIKVDKIISHENEDTEIECFITKGFIDNEEQAKEPQKVKVKAKDCTSSINLQAILQISGKVINQRLKVQITEKIESIHGLLQSLHNAALIPIFNQRIITKDQTIQEIGLRNCDRLYFYGVKNAIGQDIGGNSKIRYYRRFLETSTGSWGVGRGSWDGIKLIPKRNVTILGVSIFVPVSNSAPNFTLGFRFILKDQDQNKISESEIYEEAVVPSECVQDQERKIYWYMFQMGGIKVQKDYELDYSQWMASYASCSYGLGGEKYSEVDNDERDIFVLKGGSNSGNGTSLDRGIIPGFIYC